MKKQNIIQIEQLTELYEYASLERTPTYDTFDLLYFSDLPSATKKMLPPHRRGFFTIILFEDQKKDEVV